MTSISSVPTPRFALGPTNTHVAEFFLDAVEITTFHETHCTYKDSELAIQNQDDMTDKISQMLGRSLVLFDPTYTKGSPL